jgi:hypothetical protein
MGRYILPAADVPVVAAVCEVPDGAAHYCSGLASTILLHSRPSLLAMIESRRRVAGLTIAITHLEGATRDRAYDQKLGTLSITSSTDRDNAHRPYSEFGSGCLDRVGSATQSHGAEPRTASPLSTGGERHPDRLLAALVPAELDQQQLTAPPDINGTAGHWTCSHRLRNSRTEQAKTTTRSPGGWDARFESRWVERCRPRLPPRTSSCASDNHGVARETRNWACLSTAGRSGTPQHHTPDLRNRFYPRDFDWNGRFEHGALGRKIRLIQDLAALPGCVSNHVPSAGPRFPPGS